MFVISPTKNWKQTFAELLKIPNITFRDSGLIKEMKYKNELDELHRDPYIGSAHIGYRETGQIYFKIYYVNNKKHRPTEEGPASTWYYDNGQIFFELYCINDKLHRPSKEGSARIQYHENGNVYCEEYYINNLKTLLIKDII